VIGVELVCVEVVLVELEVLDVLEEVCIDVAGALC
jgi:hypothetical protein